MKWSLFELCRIIHQDHEFSLDRPSLNLSMRGMNIGEGDGVVDYWIDAALGQ